MKRGGGRDMRRRRIRRRGVCRSAERSEAGGRCPGAMILAKVWNSAVSVRKSETLVSEAEFTATDTKVISFSIYDCRLDTAIIHYSSFIFHFRQEIKKHAILPKRDDNVSRYHPCCRIIRPLVTPLTPATSALCHAEALRVSFSLTCFRRSHRMRPL